MVRLMIEKVCEYQGGGIVARLTGVVHVADFSLQEALVQRAHEFLQARIFPFAGIPKTGEIAV